MLAFYVKTCTRRHFCRPSVFEHSQFSRFLPEIFTDLYIDFWTGRPPNFYGQDRRAIFPLATFYGNAPGFLWSGWFLAIYGFSWFLNFSENRWVFDRAEYFYMGRNFSGNWSLFTIRSIFDRNGQIFPYDLPVIFNIAKAIFINGTKVNF